jgi:hypothetical protein
MGFVGLVKAAQAAKMHSGESPIVKCVGWDKIESPKGTTHAPRLEIINWVDTPAIFCAGGGVDLDDEPVTPPAHQVKTYGAAPSAMPNFG